jgi:hypothetical protein
MSSPTEQTSTGKGTGGASSSGVGRAAPEQDVELGGDAKVDGNGPKPSRGKARQPRNVIPGKLLSVGFVFALVLSLLCLGLSVFYLFQYLNSANTGITQVLDKVATQQIQLETGQLEVLINGRLVMARLGLLSCGVLAGVAFGFLGFALFLIGIKETMDVSFDGVSYKANVARMSPGVFLVVIAAVLIGVCASRETPFNYSIEEMKPSAPRVDPTPGGAPDSSPTPEVKGPRGLAPRIAPDQP